MCRAVLPESMGWVQDRRRIQGHERRIGPLAGFGSARVDRAGLINLISLRSFNANEQQYFLLLIGLKLFIEEIYI